MVETKLNEINLVDVAIFRHGFMPYMRDYFIEYEAGGTNPNVGRYLCIFTHCVVAHVVTQVEHEVWLNSWNDKFIDYQTWLDAGEPEGFVWGVNWSMAYPGLEYISNSKLASSWSEKLKNQMHEAIVQTESFSVQLVFHDVKVEKISSDVSMIDKAIFPLK